MKKHRTDLAYEEVTDLLDNENIRHQKKVYNQVEANHVKILNAIEEINKSVGDYISVEFKRLDEKEARKDIIQVCTDCLKDLLKELKQPLRKFLVVGLGNQEITADALGPKAAKNIIVTSHLYRYDELHSDSGAADVAVITPGVMGQTGLESAEFVKAVAQIYEPDCIIAIDALATRSIDRINRVIQITNTGIQPGAGVGNHRMALNIDSMNVPVIAMGVATVVSVEALIDEILESLNEQDQDKIKKIIRVNESYQMVVTPKEMDEEIKHLSEIISKTINYTLHQRFEEF